MRTSPVCLASLRSIVLLGALVSNSALAADFDTSPAWPLCGHITANPPGGWDEEDGCPSNRWGSAAPDTDISDTFGPRQIASESYRYDWHRGIDIQTDCGSPVFAIADGKVKITGIDSGYSDLLVQIEHRRPGYSSCSSGGGCYYSNYMHLAGVVSGLTFNQTVSKGELIGWTGYSNIGKSSTTVGDKCDPENIAGFEHIHFEVRNANSSSYYTKWQQDAIHPLGVLQTPETSAPSAVEILSVDDSISTEPIVTAEITLDDDQLDLMRVEAVVYEIQPNESLEEVTQVGATPDANGYYVDPPWLDLDEWNYDWTHKGGTEWSSFSNCPYAADHDSGYDANYHLDNELATNSQVGDFNGLHIAPANFNVASSEYVITVTFNVLDGVADADDLCVKVVATDVDGNATTDWSANCPSV